MLDDLGLIETCRWYLADWSSTTGIQASGRWMQSDAGLDDTLKTDMFRILQELLTNVAKHANATRVWVTLSRRGRTACPCVSVTTVRVFFLERGAALVCPAFESGLGATVVA